MVWGYNIYIVAIDPGHTGGIALFKVLDGKVVQIKLVVMPYTAKYKHIECGKLLEWIAANSFLNDPGCEMSIIIEKVHAMPGNGVSSMFTFGRSFGNVEAVAHCLMKLAEDSKSKVKTYFIEPVRWMKEMLPDVPPGLKGKEKKEHHAAKLLSLFPKLENNIKGGKGAIHSGLVDAVLLAEFGRRVLNKEVDLDLINYEVCGSMDPLAYRYVANNRRLTLEARKQAARVLSVIRRHRSQKKGASYYCKKLMRMEIELQNMQIRIEEIYNYVINQELK